MRDILKSALSAVFLLVALSACNSDDNTEYVPTVASVPGEYQGTVSGTMVHIGAAGDSVAYPLIPNGDEEVVVTTNQDGTVNVKTPTFYTASPSGNDASGKYAYPGVTIRNVTLSADGNVVRIDAKAYSGMNGFYSVTGTIKGLFQGKDISVDYTYLHAGGMDGKIHFTGKRR
ncbi:MAG: hypothetical protein ACI3X4_00355 [Bacteroidaceae bacterium]